MTDPTDPASLVDNAWRAHAERLTRTLDCVMSACRGVISNAIPKLDRKDPCDVAAAAAAIRSNIYIALLIVPDDQFDEWAKAAEGFGATATMITSVQAERAACAREQLQ